MKAGEATPWIAFHRAQPAARVRLFCFPHAGGGASLFRGWADQLPGSVEVCPVQLPGREARLQEAPFRRADALVGPLLRALAGWLDRPFALCGHSMGAAIAHRLAVELRAEGGPAPVLLAVAGRQAPQLPPLQPPFFDLPRDAFVERLRELQGTPPEVLAHEDLMEVLMPLLRADLELNDTYRPPLGEPLDVAVSAFGGDADPHVGRDAIGAWQQTTRGPFRLHVLSGDHFFLRTAAEPLLAALAADLDAAMEVATTGRPRT